MSVCDIVTSDHDTMCIVNFLLHYLIDCGGIEPPLGTPVPVINQRLNCQNSKAVPYGELKHAHPLGDGSVYGCDEEPALQSSARCFPRHRPLG